MRPTDAGTVLLLSNGALMAGVLADALPPDSIPIQCATICGPMVELSSICSGGRGQGKDFALLGKRRNIIQENEPVAMDRKEEAARQPKDGADIAERAIIVIVPAQKSFPSSLIVQDGTSSPFSTSRITRIRPTQILPTQELPPPPPPPPPSPSASSPPPPSSPTANPASTQSHPSPSTSTPPSGEEVSPPTTEPRSGVAAPTTSRHPQTPMDAVNGGDDDGDGDGESTNSNYNTATPDKDQGRWTMNTGEEECVCQNKSFDVPNVAALCASCVAGAEQLQNDMDVIMTTCKFAPVSYSPDKDKVVNNIQVQATPPKAVLGQNAGVASSATWMNIPMQRVQIAVGATMGWLQLWLL